MKLILFFVAALLTVSCSSNKKTVETDPVPAPAKEEPAKKEGAVKMDSEAPAPSASRPELPMIEGESLMDVKCALGRDQRVISLLKRTDATGWGVVYEKFGEKKTIAIARNDKSFCDEIVNGVKANLQGAGFQCDGEAAAQESSAPVEAVKEAAATTADATKEKAASAADAVKEAASGAVNAVKEGASEAVEKAKEATEGN